jgi:hypothetical protein
MARDLLSPVYGWFAEGLDTPVLKEAKDIARRALRIHSGYACRFLLAAARS